MEKNRVGGRPKKENKKDAFLKIRVTTQEREAIDRLLEASIYTSKSEMIRDITLKGVYKVIQIDPELREEKSVLITKCKFIGNNFNQLLKQLHQKKLHYFTEKDIEELKKHLSTISNFFQEIQKTAP